MYHQMKFVGVGLGAVGHNSCACSRLLPSTTRGKKITATKTEGRVLYMMGRTYAVTVTMCLSSFCPCSRPGLDTRSSRYACSAPPIAHATFVPSSKGPRRHSLASNRTTRTTYSMDFWSMICMRDWIYVIYLQA